MPFGLMPPCPAPHTAPRAAPAFPRPGRSVWATRRDRGLGHPGALAGRGVLHDREAASAPDPAQARRAVRVRSGQDDAHQPRAVGLGGRLEQDVDRGAACLHRRLGREREAFALHEQVVVGRREVHDPRLDRLVVRRLVHRES